MKRAAELLLPGIVAEVREIAERRGSAVRQKRQARRLRRLLDEMEQEFGPIPDKVRDDVHALEWPA
jgi:hypothetical protein